AIYRIDSEQRKILHLAAVFACNFSNHLYHLANTVLATNNLQFDLLRPLIMETALKVQDDLPLAVQTGPAVRQDEQTMKNHLELLQSKPELQEIYQTLSNSIKKTHL
ncbi:MAG: oxidoreductase, partial [Pedobacter sp.]|nr:oxidoreductase [Pedobacter sp.]